jgi:hypothetical protein
LLVLGSYDKEQKGNSRESIRSILNELSTKSDGLVVVIRPHPADESFDPKYLFRGDFVGKTADFILGGVQQIDIDQARALADGVISFDSTETIVAWKLGKPAAFAQRHDNRASYDVYQDIITQSSGGIVVIPNENGADSLVSFLAKVASFKSTSRPCSTSDIGAKMLNEILRHS